MIAQNRSMRLENLLQIDDIMSVTSIYILLKNEKLFDDNTTFKLLFRHKEKIIVAMRLTVITFIGI